MEPVVLVHSSGVWALVTELDAVFCETSGEPAVLSEADVFPFCCVETEL